MKRLLVLLFVLYLCSITTHAQNVVFRSDPLKIYVDCNTCDMDYITQYFSYWIFVRDQADADVYVMVRSQAAGSGGVKYEMEFYGQGRYTNLYSTVDFTTYSNQTQSEKRDEMINHLDLGISPFWSQAFHNARERYFEDTTQVVAQDPEPIQQTDKWKSWVFNLGANGSYSGEESSKSSSYGFNISAKQVTEKNKFYLRANLANNQSEYTYGPTKIISEDETKELEISDAVSLGNKWSVGAFIEAGSSDYENMDLFVSFKPAIEYSFFPYKEAAKRQVTLTYKIGGMYNNYIEETIFFKNTEYLWEHSLSIGASLIQKWGSLSGEASYESYLHDMDLHALNFYFRTNVRIYKGLSFNVSASYKINNNQVNITGGDLSVEELLLRQQQVKSGYNFFMTMGLNFSFGSMYNAIVNPRFGF